MLFNWWRIDAASASPKQNKPRLVFPFPAETKTNSWLGLLRAYRGTPVNRSRIDVVGELRIPSLLPPPPEEIDAPPLGLLTRLEARANAGDSRGWNGGCWRAFWKKLETLVWRDVNACWTNSWRGGGGEDELLSGGGGFCWKKFMLGDWLAEEGGEGKGFSCDRGDLERRDYSSTGSHLLF